MQTHDSYDLHPKTYFWVVKASWPYYSYELCHMKSLNVGPEINHKAYSHT